MWLILIVVILFTGFPPAFSTIKTALNLPITLMLVGIVLRGAAFSFRSYASTDALTDRRWMAVGVPRAAIWHGLNGRAWTWPLFWVTAILALVALYALEMRNYRFARFCAAGEVTLILWGWAFAQFPYIVGPTLTIYNSSAAPLMIELLAGALLAGSFLLLPSDKYLLEIFKSNDRPLDDRVLSRSFQARRLSGD